MTQITVETLLEHITPDTMARMLAALLADGSAETDEAVATQVETIDMLWDTLNEIQGMATAIEAVSSYLP